jgi:general secretion pathway protein G
VGRGFTLLELLAVITIVVILAALGIGTWSYITIWTATHVTEGRVEALGSRAFTVLREKGVCPGTLVELAPWMNRPSWMENGVFVDAWGRPLDYTVNGKTFRVRSAGPDGVFGTGDDIEFAR